MLFRLTVSRFGHLVASPGQLLAAARQYAPIERLCHAHIGAVGHALRTAKQISHLGLGVGQFERCAVGQPRGLQLAAGSLECRVVVHNAQQDVAPGRALCTLSLCVCHGSAAAGERSYDDVSVFHFLRVLSGAMMGTINRLSRVLVSSPPSMTWAMGL